MPIKNYTPTVPANRSITEIQDTHVKHGATGVLYTYEQGTGRIEALQFLLPVKEQNVTFALPVHFVLYETEMVDMPQVFLPFATDAKGQTLYEKVAQSKFLLGDGRETSRNPSRARDQGFVAD